ncbi:MAG: SLC13 family permease [Planctomycetota bacterium]
MSLDAWITVGVLASTVVFLIRETLPIGLVALLAPLVLVLTGVLEDHEMWKGLSNPAVVAVGAMMVVSEAVSRTGALGFLGDGLARLEKHGQRFVLLALAATVALMSAFTNNTTVVLVFLPVVLSMCKKQGLAPSRFLIPLSFASILGGMTTLVGTSTNVVVAEVGRREVLNAYGEDLFNPGMWDFLPLGAIFMLAGIAYLVILGPRLLPDRVVLSMSLSSGVPTQYFTEADVPDGSPLVGQPLADVTRKFGVRVIELIRREVIEIPRPETLLEAGDTLLLTGSPGQIIDFSDRAGASLLPGMEPSDLKTRGVELTLAEVIVPPRSQWIHRRIKEIGFRSRFDVDVIAVQRHGHHVRTQVGDLRVQPADMLLVQGTPESLRKIRQEDSLILLEGVSGQIQNRRKAPIALGVLALFVGLVAILRIDLAVAAVVAAAVMVLLRAVTLQQAYQSFDWNVLFMLAGFLGLGTALEKTGLARDTATAMITLLADAPLWMVFGTTYLLAAFLSDIITNAAVAALMVPVMVQASRLLDMSPVPFLMTVAFAASAAFLTPMGYQTNLLVYGPGGYRVSDFVKIGLPLRLGFAVIAAFLVPVFYPP